jgi:hypothetical protein
MTSVDWHFSSEEMNEQKTADNPENLITADSTVRFRLTEFWFRCGPLRKSANVLAEIAKSPSPKATTAYTHLD